MKRCIPQEEFSTRAGEQTKQERAAEVKCYETAATPIPHPAVLLSEGGCRNTMTEIELQEK